MKRSTLIIIIGAVFAAAVLSYVLTLPKGGEQVSVNGGNQTSAESQARDAVVNENGDLIISTAEITDAPTFYAYNELDSKMEILAVKASDGTIRTAFNTCQVCYSSGRGYYKAEGDLLTCQNCGNQFSMDQVELVKGGCNPVPITTDNKITDEDTITIPKEFLEEAEVIFQNWKV